MDLFDYMSQEKTVLNQPLAEKMKPTSLDTFKGQDHILGEGKLLRRMILADQLQSIILYGPPGTGKTSIARVIASSTQADFMTLNAVTSGVKDIRQVVSQAVDNLGMYQRKTVLFIDEIHRFNKAQQDALLPDVEKGNIILIGATTENPFYEVNGALISRSTVFRLNPLSPGAIEDIVNQAIKDDINGLGMFPLVLTQDGMDHLIEISGGDARRVLNALELGVNTTPPNSEGHIYLDKAVISECAQKKSILYDKNGDAHYDVISAFIKSMRGSDPDATLHYLARMLYAGEDIKFIARRIIIAASEDVGLADSQALVVAKNAFDAVHMIGMPEARIILSHAALYVATAPKSNSAYTGINQAMRDVENGQVGPVPSHLRDQTSNSLKMKYQMQDESPIEAYKYPHNYDSHYVDQQYLPDNLMDRRYFKACLTGRDTYRKPK